MASRSERAVRCQRISMQQDGLGGRDRLRTLPVLLALPSALEVAHDLLVRVALTPSVGLSYRFLDGLDLPGILVDVGGDGLGGEVVLAAAGAFGQSLELGLIL